MSDGYKIHTRLGMVLVTACLCVVGSACGEATSSPIDEGAVGEAEGAYVSHFSPGAKFSCTMSGPTVTGRRWAYLVVGNDNSTCYRYADVYRQDPAPPDIEHCKGLGRRIGCDTIIDY